MTPPRLAKLCPLVALGLAACRGTPAKPEHSAATSTAASAAVNSNEQRAAPSASAGPRPSASGVEGSSRCVTLASLGAAPLGDEPAFPGAARGALAVVRRELTRLLDRPGDYHAVAEDGGALVIVELWPSRYVQSEACLEQARRDQKSRIITIDVASRRIVGTRWAADASD